MRPELVAVVEAAAVLGGSIFVVFLLRQTFEKLRWSIIARREDRRQKLVDHVLDVFEYRRAERRPAKRRRR